MEHKNIWDKYGMEEEKAIVELCEGYKEYLNHGKTDSWQRSTVIGICRKFWQRARR